MQVKFDREDHGFVLVTDREFVSILNVYDGVLYNVRTHMIEFRILIRSIELNKGNNRDIITALFGFQPAFASDYHVIDTVYCSYWPRMFGLTDYKKYLKDVARNFFIGRNEENIINKLIKYT